MVLKANINSAHAFSRLLLNVDKSSPCSEVESSSKTLAVPTQGSAYKTMAYSTTQRLSHTPTSLRRLYCGVPFPATIILLYEYRKWRKMLVKLGPGGLDIIHISAYGNGASFQDHEVSVDSVIEP